MSSNPPKQQRPTSNAVSATLGLDEINTHRPRQDSLRVQPDDLTENHNPGPGAYRTEDERAMRAVYPVPPSYSLTERHKRSDYSCTPGPGSYSVPNQRAYKKSPPAYSLGNRHSLHVSTALIIEYKD